MLLFFMSLFTSVSVQLVSRSRGGEAELPAGPAERTQEEVIHVQMLPVFALCTLHKNRSYFADIACFSMSRTLPWWDQFPKSLAEHLRQGPLV